MRTLASMRPGDLAALGDKWETHGASTTQPSKQHDRRRRVRRHRISRPEPLPHSDTTPTRSPLGVTARPRSHRFPMTAVLWPAAEESQRPRPKKPMVHPLSTCVTNRQTLKTCTAPAGALPWRRRNHCRPCVVAPRPRPKPVPHGARGTYQSRTVETAHLQTLPDLLQSDRARSITIIIAVPVY